MNAEKNKENRFVVCIKNEGYPASLEVRRPNAQFPMPNSQFPDMLKLTVRES